MIWAERKEMKGGPKKLSGPTWRSWRRGGEEGDDEDEEEEVNAGNK